MPFPLGPVDIVRNADDPTRRTWVLEKPFTWASADGRHEITAQQGLTTDFASIPQIAQIYTGPPHRFAEAAIPHDSVYALAGVHRYSRSRADLCFRLILIEIDVRPTKAWAMWLGVRLGGWWPWYGRVLRRWWLNRSSA